MRISLAFNLQTEESEEQGEFLTQEDVDRITGALEELGHEAVPVEVTGYPDEIVDRIYQSKPDLIFNVAEGIDGQAREAIYPGIFKMLNIPYTGGECSILLVEQDKFLADHILAVHGVRVPKAKMVTPQRMPSSEGMNFPLIVKPDYEGSSIGITQDSIIENDQEFSEKIPKWLNRFPDGLVVEEFIVGRELSVPMLEAYPEKVLPIVEHVFKLDGVVKKHSIYDFEMKHKATDAVEVVCPAELKPEDEQAVRNMSIQVFDLIKTSDFGRVDIRMKDDGTPFVIEINPLPSLHPNGSLMQGANAVGLSYADAIGMIVDSAAKRYGLSVKPSKITFAVPKPEVRSTVRDLGVPIGRFPTGEFNAITDVEGVQVGHVTIIRDDVAIPESDELTRVRTGITAIIPASEKLFDDHLAAGGFVLNGIGEMLGLTQVIEWGWLETPILLSNTMSVGDVHSGIVSFMMAASPDLGRILDVIIPVVGETNDWFLNDVRIRSNTADEAIRALTNAQGGPVEQGSVGGGTGMMSFDFAGGIGTSSRVVSVDDETYKLGVLAQSNFGKMRNLTIDGMVAGRQLDSMFPYEGRRENSGSVIVVVATDAPLLPGQLNRLGKRAALGLGRVGSHAASSSGEIIICFSVANRSSREEKGKFGLLDMRYIGNRTLNLFYEAVIETTEEAVLNAIFCSGGMSGRNDRFAPAVPQDEILDMLERGRKISKLPTIRAA